MKQHIDRVPGKPNRYAVYDDEHNFLRFEYHERADEPVQEGNPINKALQDEFLAASGTTTGTPDAFILSQPGFVLSDGATIRLKLHTDMNKGATLNVSETGAHPIIDSRGKQNKALAGSWVTVIYNSSTGNFILQGSGGDALRFGNEPGQISSYELIQFEHFNPYSVNRIGGQF